MQLNVISYINGYQRFVCPTNQVFFQHFQYGLKITVVLGLYLNFITLDTKRSILAKCVYFRNVVYILEVYLYILEMLLLDAFWFGSF